MMHHVIYSRDRFLSGVSFRTARWSSTNGVDTGDTNGAFIQSLLSAVTAAAGEQKLGVCALSQHPPAEIWNARIGKSYIAPIVQDLYSSHTIEH
jgi:hypothetical protein